MQGSVETCESCEDHMGHSKYQVSQGSHAVKPATHPLGPSSTGQDRGNSICTGDPSLARDSHTNVNGVSGWKEQFK
jgi:hypothetical protein